MNHRVTLIPGDGIGPEIAAAVRHVFAAAGVPVTWDEAEAGLAAIEKYGNGLPDATLESIRANRVALKGPTTTPVGGGHKSLNVTLRKTLELYANVRPAHTLPGIKSRYDHVDLVIVRENVEDTYAGIEYRQTPDVAMALKVITRPGSLAICRYAFELARSWGRKRVTCVQKANIHKMSDGLFLESFREVAPEYPELQADEMLVDNCCMQLVTRPEQFDVLVMPNLYGDIVSDLCAGLVGGLGVAPGGNIGRECAVFEAVHGSAPDIAGKGLANPTALLLSSIQMLRYLGLHADAARIDVALRGTLATGTRTRDLGGQASTTEFAEAIARHLPPAGAAAAPAQGAVRTAPAGKPASARADGPGAWELRGADVYLRADRLPDVPAQVGSLALSMISNRGTKVWPGPLPDILLVDWYRCRYLADRPVTPAEVDGLLAQLGRDWEWVHVEQLHTLNGAAAYSQA